MKRILLLAVCALLCLGVFVSCDSMEEKVGERASVLALDQIQPELEGAGFDTFKRYGAGDTAVFEIELKQELAKQDLALTGKVTGVLTGDYTNPDTGDWVKQMAIGVSVSSDVDVLMTYYQSVYKTELEQGKAVLTDGGWIINITVSSQIIDAETEG